MKRKHKKYIQSHLHKFSSDEMAKRLNIKRKHIEEYIKQLNSGEGGKKTYREPPAILSKKNILLGCLGIIVLGLIIYSNTFSATFVFDDRPALEQNIHIRDITDLQSIKAFYPSRTVAFFTFALNYHFHKLNPFGYHLTNVCIHLLSTFLVWWFVYLLLSTPRMADEKIRQHREWISLFTALIFLSHPIQTQAISYIYQRVASLASMFYLLTLCLYIKGRLSLQDNNARSSQRSNYFNYFYFLGSLMAAFLAVFTKELIITIPFTIILIEVFFLKELKTFKNRWMFIAIVLLMVFIVPTVDRIDIIEKLNIERISESHTGDIITFNKYLLTQLRVIVLSLRLLFIPTNQNVDYDFPLSNSLFEVKTFLSLLITVIVLALGYKLRKKNVLLSFGIFWFMATLSYNFIPRENVFFEHRLYLPSVGMCLFISTLIYTQAKTLKAFVMINSIVILVFSGLTFERNKVWKNPITLWSDVIVKSPQKARGFHSLGHAYYQNKDYEKAEKYYSQALVLDPSYLRTYLNRGVVYTIQKKYNLAINDFNEALKRNPQLPEVLNNRGNAYKAMKQYDLALKDYSKALEIVRNKEISYRLFNNRSYIYIKLKKYDLALADLQKVLDYNPYFVAAYVNRGNIYKLQNQFDKALDDYNTAITMNPDAETIHMVYNDRAIIYIKKKDFDKALENLNTALQVHPGYLESLFNRGTIYRLQGRHDLALADYNAFLAKKTDYPQLYYAKFLSHKALGEDKLAEEAALKAKSLGLIVSDNYIEDLKDVSDP